MNLKELLDAVREAADPRVWSEGVTVARQPVVVVEAESSDEIVLRVTHPTSKLSAQVHLFPNDGDWTCSIQRQEDPNVFVCAAIIGYKKLKDSGQEINLNPSAHVCYPLAAHGDYLHFHRAISRGDDAVAVTSPLSTLQGKPGFPTFTALPLDWTIDKLVGFDVKGPLNSGTWLKIIQELSGHSHVTVDGKVVEVNRTTLCIDALVTDEGSGIYLKGRLPFCIQSTFRNGLALTKDLKLHPFRPPHFPPPLNEWLMQGHFISRQELSTFVAEYLPILRERCNLVSQAKNLPEDMAAAKLKVALEAKSEAKGCSITATLVYGEPPLAVVTGEGFMPLGPIIPVRQKELEQKLRDEVWQTYGLNLGKARFLSEDQALALLSKWRQHDIIQDGTGWQTYRISEALVPSLDIASDTVSLKFLAAGQEIAAKGVLQRFSSNESMLFIEGVGGFTLPLDWLQEFAALAQQLADGRSLTDLQKTLLSPQIVAAAQKAQETLPISWHHRAKQLEALLNPNTVNQSQPLPPLNAKLRPYQTEGIQWLAQLQQLELGGVLADDMGLGKTLQTLAIMRDNVLIVVPTTLLFNWEHELQKFRPDLTYLIYHGSNRKWPSTLPNVLITSYGILRIDLERFVANNFNLIVADEAHSIKNSDSQTAQAMHQLQGRCRIALTGTPVENHLTEIWSIYRFALPELLGEEAQFKEGFIDKSAIGLASLKSRLKPFLLRRLKETVAKDLPPKTQSTVWIDLAESEQVLYEAVKASARQNIAEASHSVMQLLELILRLRQAACHGQLLPGIEQAQSSKVSILLERLAEIREAGLHALVFSQWTKFLDLIESPLRDSGHQTLRIDGTTKHRQDIVANFQEASQPTVLLMSLKAGGVGLNLTAADHVFIMDPWWNPAAERQAADRAHRIGRERPVFVHKFIARQTIEEDILRLQESKAGLAEALLDGQDAAGSLTRDDLLGLLDRATQKISNR